MHQVNGVEEYQQFLDKYDFYEEKYLRGQKRQYDSILPSIARASGYLDNEENIYHLKDT